MGRLLSRVPNENPDRLQRVLNAKYRTIGVRSQMWLQRDATRFVNRGCVGQLTIKMAILGTDGNLLHDCIRSRREKKMCCFANTRETNSWLLELLSRLGMQWWGWGLRGSKMAMARIWID